MRREFSAGGLVFNSQGQVLLIQNSRSFNWGFPKGMIEAGQTSKQAAIREVREEGGVDAEIVTKIGDSTFIYTKEREKIYKSVAYYLMRYLKGNPKDHDHEVSEAGWYEIERALTTLSFKDDIAHLKKAVEYLKSHDLNG